MAKTKGSLSGQWSKYNNLRVNNWGNPDLIKKDGI